VGSAARGAARRQWRLSVTSDSARDSIRSSTSGLGRAALRKCRLPPLSSFSDPRLARSCDNIVFASIAVRLITIRISHFNERARWALDRFALEYEEEPYMPLLHFAAVARVTGVRGGFADPHSTRFSTPVLLTDSGRVLTDSAMIVRWASDSFGTAATTLYPAARRAAIEQFEEQARERLGPHTRRVGYSIAFGNPTLLASLADRNVGPLQARAFRYMAPALVAMIRRRLHIDSQAPASLDHVRRFLDEVAAQLGTRQYLFDDRFTAADLSLSALLAPLLLPTRAEGYAATLPALDELSERGVAVVREVREHPVGRFCLRMFASERGERRIPCAP
jgi:glutathione S-transferase